MIEKFSQYKKHVIIGFVLLAAVIICLFFFNQTQEDGISGISKTGPSDSVKAEARSIPKEKPKNVVIDIKGAILYPGVYELPSDSRVRDAIQKAGGLTKEADAVVVNQAERLKDEMTIYINKEGEKPKIIKQNDEVAKSEASKVNLNQATAIELEKVPGIGAAKAKAIISQREKEGLFQSIDDLKKVSGIGAKTVEKLNEYLEV